MFEKHMHFVTFPVVIERRIIIHIIGGMVDTHADHEMDHRFFAIKA